jgi:hypothetical protein
MRLTLKSNENVGLGSFLISTHAAEKDHSRCQLCAVMGLLLLVATMRVASDRQSHLANTHLIDRNIRRYTIA